MKSKIITRLKSFRVVLEDLKVFSGSALVYQWILILGIILGSVFPVPENLRLPVLVVSVLLYMVGFQMKRKLQSQNVGDTNPNEKLD